MNDLGAGLLSIWLNRVAEELDTRFGPHAMVPRSQVLEITKEVVERDAGWSADKEEIWQALEASITQAFKGTPLDH